MGRLSAQLTNRHNTRIRANLISAIVFEMRAYSHRMIGHSDWASTRIFLSVALSGHAFVERIGIWEVNTYNIAKPRFESRQQLSYLPYPTYCL
jgi:hypothetical protein